MQPFIYSLDPAASLAGLGHLDVDAGAGSIVPSPHDAPFSAGASDHVYVDERALVTSRNHREAEKRRRERIKSHFDRLRAVLACDPKIDKASLLGMAVEQMKELKHRMDTVVADTRLLPADTDEIVVVSSSGVGGGCRMLPSSPSVYEASICCDDRSDLFPDLIETLRALRLRTLRAEMATLGGRLRNVLILARESVGANVDEGDEDEDDDGGAAGTDGADFLRDALRALIDRPSPPGRPKRRRVVGVR